MSANAAKSPQRQRSTEVLGSRERFQSLDLETLQQEFKEVATQDDSDPIEEEPEPQVEGEEESKWLENVGLEALTEKVKNGKPITDADLKEEMQGFTPAQVQAVKARVETLNGTLRGKSKPKKADARDLFPDAASPPAAMASSPSERPPIVAIPPPPDMEELPTSFYDLSDSDQKQVQCLNLIQLTSVLESTTKAPVRPTKSKRKKKGKDKVSIYGSRLSELVERDKKVFKDKLLDEEVPVILSKFIAFLRDKGIEEEGIFRKAGSAARIKTLRQQCEDAKGDLDFYKLDCRPHDVAALLKQFLRELRDPLLTDEYIETFAQTQGLTPDLQLYSLQLLVMLLPKTNRCCLKLLLDFLNDVAKNSAVNKMGFANLAVVFAPTLFYVRGQKGQKMLKEVEMQVSTAATLKVMLESNHLLWRVPPDIMSQIRFVNEQRVHGGRKPSKPKDVKRILSDKKKPGKGEPPAPASGGESSLQWVADSTEVPPVRALITVTMSNGEPRTGVKIYDSSTAESVMKGLNVKDDCCLAECGGNIGCRRLDLRASILQLLKINPRMSILVIPNSQFSSYA